MNTTDIEHYNHKTAEDSTVILQVSSSSSLGSSVGSGLLFPPNTIDFGAVFSDFGARLADSPVVLTVILVIFLIYVPVMVWARRMDKKDALRVSFF